MRRIIVTLLVLLVLGGVGLTVYDRLRQEYTVTYDSYTATVGTISNSLSFSGTLQLVDEKTYTAASSTSVREVYVQEGEDVKKGDELIQLADFDHMKVSIRVDEYDISDVQVGENCRITTTATDQEFDSTIASINYISSSTGSVAYYTATAYTDVTEGVYPGMQVTVTIPQEEASNVVILKMDALSFDQTNQAFVYMMGDGEEMVQVPVATGVSNGNYVEIKSGLRANDTVYVVTKTESTSTMASMFSSMFGSQRINNNNRNNTNRQNNGGYTPSGNMPSAPGGNFGGGNR